MSNAKPLSFWCEIVDFPLDNLDLLYLSQILIFFNSKAPTTKSSHLWTESLLDKIRSNFLRQGISEVPDCLDIYKEPE